MSFQWLIKLAGLASWKYIKFFCCLFLCFGQRSNFKATLRINLYSHKSEFYFLSFSWQTVSCLVEKNFRYNAWNYSSLFSRNINQGIFNVKCFLRSLVFFHVFLAVNGTNYLNWREVIKTLQSTPWMGWTERKKENVPNWCWKLKL